MAVLLPTELHEHIVLFAVSDTPNYAVHTSDNRPEFLFHLPPPNHTALRCSLVCRNWLPVGRSHAFRTIELSSDISSKTFLTLASRPLATFVPFVEDLLLNGQTPDRFINLPQDLTQLIPSLPMFPNLRHLTLVNLLLHEIERETWWHEAVPRLFRPSVIALRISYCAFASPMTFTKSIERCVNLSSLDVFDASATSSSNLEGTMCYLPALKSLYLRPSLRNIECMDVLLREILQSQVIRGHTSLNSLGIMQYSTAWPGWNLPRTLVPFVKEFGEIITSLYVTPVIPRPIEELLFNVYPHFRVLQRITFILESILKSGSNISIVAILQSIGSSTSLRTLHYNMGHVALSEARDGIEWDPVIDLMNGSHIPHLESVMVTFGGNEEAVQEWEGWIEQQIRTRLTRRGVLVQIHQAPPRVFERIFRNRYGRDA